MSNKKEIIRELKIRLEICNGQKILYRDTVEPYSKKATQRGARMQIMLKYMHDNNIIVPKQISDWFNVDGTVKL